MDFIHARTCYEEPLEGVRELVKGKTLMTEEEQKFFLQFMKDDKPKKILEIGTNVGGTTAVILHAMEKLRLNAELHSVDLGDFEQVMRNTIDGSLGVVCPNWNKESWNIYCNTTVAGVIDEIGAGIDFCVLDAAHSLPGEVLDLLAILPYLKDGAIVVLHDVRLGRRGLLRNAIATNVLFSSVVAKEKYLPLNDSEQIMNIAAFRIDSSTSEHIHNVIQALSLPWAYSMKEKHLNAYKNLVKQHYSENYEHFLKSIEFGESAGTEPVGSWDFDKEKQLVTKNGAMSLDETNKNCIVFWGYGGMLHKANSYQAMWYTANLVKEELLKEYNNLRNRHHFVDSSLSLINVYKPEYITTLGEDVVAVIITPADYKVCEDIRKELSQMGIPSEKVFLLDDFILGEKTTLNYPTGVL